MSEENAQNVQPDLAAELAKINQELAAAKQKTAAAEQKAEESHAFMEGIQRAASGQKDPPARKPQEAFVDDLINQGDRPVRNVVQEELQRQAYLTTLQTNFEKANPHLEPFKDEIFGKTNQIIAQAQAQGQNITWEAALDASTKHYDEKHKRLMKISGANASPGGNSAFPQSRYAGCEKDFFAMTDKEFMEQEMKPRDDARKKRNREALGHFGYGR